MMGLLALPPEVWLYVFHHATHVPGAPVFAPAGAFDSESVYTEPCKVALRDALVTKRALVRVCKQWWHLAIPYLYTSVYIGRARCLSSFSTALLRSANGKATLTAMRPLGEYTRRLDITIRDHCENPDAEFAALVTLINCMPCLTIFSFAIASNYFHGFRYDLPGRVMDALHHSASSLLVFDWSSIRFEPTFEHIVSLLTKCTQLRVLRCPGLVWSRALQHGGIPLTVTSLRVRFLTPLQLPIPTDDLPRFDPTAGRLLGPSALKELVLELDRGGHIHYWRDLVTVYAPQLVSIHFYMRNIRLPDAGDRMELLTTLCPHLRCFTITSNRFSDFVRPGLRLPSITYLGMRATRMQLPKAEFKALFAFLEDLRSRMPSLQVVQLLSEHNVQCLLKTHTKFAVRTLQPFMESIPRLEDKDGVLLTGSRRNVLGHRAWIDRYSID